MRLDEQTIRAAMNRRLSALDADPLRRARIRERIQKAEPEIMKKKLSVGLIVALILIALTVTALAAGVILSPRLGAAAIADRALEDTYGITRDMQGYFNRKVEPQPDGSAVVSYTGMEDMFYVLGTYTVTVKNGKALDVAWSRDGESTEGGFEADAWGAEQLAEMLRLNERDSNMFAFKPYIDAVNERNGIDLENLPLPEGDWRVWDEKSWDQMQAEIRGKMKLSFADMDALAREAVILYFDLDEAQAAMLRKLVVEEENPNFYDQNDQPCYVSYFLLVQHPDPVYADLPLEFVEKDGTYTVYVNVETGVIEDIVYLPPHTGNG